MKPLNSCTSNGKNVTRLSLTEICVQKTKTRLSGVRVKNSISADVDAVVRTSESVTADGQRTRCKETQAQRTTKQKRRRRKNNNIRKEGKKKKKTTTTTTMTRRRRKIIK